jgi:hypothetical protein
VIDRLAFQALPPARRAALIYGEAQAEMSQRLWRAALGPTGRSDQEDGGRLPSFDSDTRRANLDSLLALLGESAPSPAAPSAPAKPAVHASSPTTASVEVDGLGPNQIHAPALRTAAARTGIPATALAAIVDAEAGKDSSGRWQTLSRNPRSSAAGLGQFLSRTWEGMAETQGTWLNALASANGWLGGNGQVLASARANILALRYDPTAAINGIADYARRNLDGLERAGVNIDGAESGTARLAYLAHHLGLGDAIRFLRHGGLDEHRARTLLHAQVGSGDSGRRIAQAGTATAAHRNWLLGYVDHHIDAGRFARTL